MRLGRYCYADDCTRGRLYIGDQVLHTLERPWRPGAPGGMPFVSCVPDGTYRLLLHVRPSGDRVLALRNPDLGVYYSAASRPDTGGRTLILLHAANRVEEVQGCIAPGLSAIVHENRPMVTNSRDAMRLLMAHYDAHRPEAIEVFSECGTREG